MRARLVFALMALPLLTGCCASHDLSGAGSGHGHEHGAPPPPPAPTGAASQPGAAEVYSCPMHPEVTASFAATCPKCGMELVKQ